MAGTNSQSLHHPQYPQYAYALAIICGGIAFILPPAGIPVSTWQSYALLAAIFASIWPRKALQWAGWICLPMLMLVGVEFFVTWNLAAIVNNIFAIVTALAFASIGAYAGSSLSVRKLARRFAHRNVREIQAVPFTHRTGPLGPSTALAEPSSDNVPHSSAQNPEPARPHSLNEALIQAACENDLEKINLLIADGADIDARTLDPLPAFIPPLFNAHKAQPKTLFGYRASFEEEEKRRWTPLMIATIEGHLDVVRALVAKGADVDAKNYEGWTAARFAVSMDDAEILRVLLEGGANPDVVDNQRNTALMQASAENIEASLKVLLEGGADTLIQDQKGETALTIARKHGHSEIVRLLTQATAACVPDVAKQIEIGAPAVIIENTHRVVTIRRDPYVGLVDRYDVIPVNVSLPEGWTETGRIGPEEECRDYALRNNINEPSEIGWWLAFSS